MHEARFPETGAIQRNLVGLLLLALNLMNR
jgi:hypothetical protein